jgi:CBS-domain-containing membrane protein
MRQANDDGLFGTVPSFMTTDVVTARFQTPLLDLVRKNLNARAGCIIVLDELNRPIGVVSAADIQPQVHGRGN